MNIALRRTDADEPGQGAGSGTVDIADIGRRASRLGIEIADIVGLIDDLGGLGRVQLETLRSVVRSARESGETNSRLARSMEEARSSAADTRSVLDAGAATLSTTLSHAVDNMRTLSEGVLGFNDSLEKVSSTIAAVREASASINEIARETQLVALNASIEAARLGESVRELASLSKNCQGKLDSAGQRSQAILDISEDFILFIAQSGIETPDTPVIEICRMTADTIAELFAAAVDRGEMSMSDLFDENYVPVPGTNPQQVLTRFTAFTDRVLPPIQEPVVKLNERITFCAAVDRNGYLPTHNLVYSKPQGDDPVWNAANCRNHRIFNDRTGLGAGRNTRPFLLQTYRRDMGGGNFVLMKDVSAPIVVKGRHWGGFRIGFKP
jgi:methyl-accepting chemotaxis protein